MRSGYVTCPQCGEATVANDDSKPELCFDCRLNAAAATFKIGDKVRIVGGTLAANPRYAGNVGSVLDTGRYVNVFWSSWTAIVPACDLQLVEQDAKRERDTGRYAPSVDRPCVCGHSLDEHTAARVKGQQPCLSGDLTGVPCSCSCFKAARVKRAKPAK